MSLHIAYYESDIVKFCRTNELDVLGRLAEMHGFSLEIQQRIAWQEQIKLLQTELSSFSFGHIFFEFSIPRMGRRADVVLLIENIVFVLEFKVGSQIFERVAIDQVHDYALDLKNFHKASHHLPILPILWATKASIQKLPSIAWAEDDVAAPVFVGAQGLETLLRLVLSERPTGYVDVDVWMRSGYKPTPTIIEAAQALYRNHNVQEIARSDASAQNLSVTTDRISEIIETAKAKKRKSICFVTGVPGAGKTLAGLNVATIRAQEHSDEHAVFLSGNGPLVEVLREALARDQATREGISKAKAQRSVSSFVQNIHHFRDESLKSISPPPEHVVVFDEAQRAWGREQASRFMQQKRGYPDFDMSEPAFLISVMDRHTDWCVVVCLVGGGQEINTGEAGLTEWLSVINQQFSHWDVFVSHRLGDPDYFWDDSAHQLLTQPNVTRDDALHLSVSMRSFRAETLSEFAGHLVENRPSEARLAYANIAKRYPIVLTRSLEQAKSWLRGKARGTERFGFVASSGAHRLRPEGICVKEKVDAAIWFLNDPSDVRTSFYLEEAATEFDIQGLELDWIGVCWDADYRYSAGEWKHHSFRGTCWQKVNADERQLYLKNAYRVILTRARQGMVIYVPLGNSNDATRSPDFYDQTFEYLSQCGLPILVQSAPPQAALMAQAHA